MSKLIETYLRYGVSSDLAIKYDNLDLSVTAFRSTPIKNLTNVYKISEDEATWVKKCISRQPIEEDIVQRLLDNSNFLCCCCKGMKSESYVIHHIIKYETSQDNSYDNLVVLCPNDHDLAHGAGLTNRITPDQIRKSKATWEQQVQIHNLLGADREKKEQFLLSLPRYQNILREVELLKERLTDKEKLLTRSDAFFDAEISQLKIKISELEIQRTTLENQVIETAQKLSQYDFSVASRLFSEAVASFLRGDFANALAILSISELDDELNRIKEQQKEVNDSIKNNADSRILRAQLLIFEERFEEANESAGTGLQLYEQLAQHSPEEYLIDFAIALENVGTIYYNTSEYDAALNCFISASNVCDALLDMERYEQVPLIATIMQNIGAAYYSKNDFETARHFLEKANIFFGNLNSIHNEIKDFNFHVFEFRHAVVLTNLGTTYGALGMVNEAISAYNQGQKVWEELLNTTNDKKIYLEGVVRNLSGLGTLYLKHNLDEAEKTYMYALPRINDLTKLGSVYESELADANLNLCAIYIQKKENEKAEKFCKVSLKQYRELSKKGEKMEMQLAAALMYSCILEHSKKGMSSEIIRMATETVEICGKYPDNIDAQTYQSLAKKFLAKVKNNQ